MAMQRKWRIGLVVLAVGFLTSSLFGSIVEIRNYHGKQVSCVHSGIVGVAKGCGTEWYARVFTGTVASSVESGDTDKVLELVPDEAFLGDSSEVTVITNQACLNADIQAGDKWLFYLSQNSEGDKLVLSYNSPSKPISEAEDEISMLRDLGHLKDAGILIGTVERLGDSEDVKPLPLANYQLVAKNVKNGIEYTARTNDRGYFKFDLPAGAYDVATAPEYGLRVVESLGSMLGSVPVENRRCWEHDFAVKPLTAIKPKTDGTISGHVGSPDGKPFTVHPWVQIVSVESELFTSAYVDAKGHFEAKDVKPGRYVVGLGIRPGTGYFSDVPIPVYYPGVRTKEEATIIELRPSEKRTNVDFQLPPEDVLKPLVPARSDR
jgi:hypothetical protein